MKDGFLKVGAATPKTKVGDVRWNVEQMKQLAEEAYQKGVRLLVFRNSVSLLIPVEICLGRNFFWTRQRKDSGILLNL